MEEKYRKVKLGNAAFQKRLGGLPGGDAAMKAVGFVVETQDGAEVYQLQASPEAWPQLIKNKQTVEAAVKEAKSASATTPAAVPGGGVGAGGVGGVPKQPHTELLQKQTPPSLFLQLINHTKAWKLKKT